MDINGILQVFRRRTVLGWLLRYGLAFFTLGFAFLFRATLTAWVGPGLPIYTTFYPMIMLVALVGGIGPALAGTLWVCLLVDRCILPEQTLIVVGTSIQGIGELFFLVNALITILLVELYRRSRDKAAAYDREGALMEGLARLASFAEATFEAIIESKGGRILDCNEQTAALTGYSVAELRGMEIASLVAPEDLAVVIENVKENRDSVLQHGMLHKDGRTIYVEAHGRPLEPGSERRITAVRDVTERRQAAAGLQQAHDDLDARVRERTADLANTLDSLVQEKNERDRVEEALRQSEERYRRVVEDQVDTICRFQADGTYLFVNEVFCRLFDKTPGELVGQKWHPEAHSEDIPLVEAQLSTLSPDNPVVSIENRIVTGSGETRWMQFLNRGLYDENGRLLEIQSVGRDVTERKQIEAILAESQAQLYTVIDSTDDLIWAVEPSSFGLTIFNRGLADYFSRFRGVQLRLGMTPEELFPEGEFKQRWRAFYRCALEEGPFTTEYQTFSGGMLLELSFNLLKREETVFGISVFAKDITGRKLWEAELERSRSFLDAVIEQSPINLWISDQHGTLLRTNRAMRNQFQLTDEEVVGVYNIFEDNEIKAQGLLPQVRAVFEKGEGAHFTIEYDTAKLGCLVLKNSSRAILDVTISPIFDIHGQLTNAVVQHMDITALKELERNLRDAKLVAEAANVAKSQFLATMSHEIRTPMNGVIGMLELLQHSPLSPQQQHYVQVAKNSGIGLVNLLNDILDLSRVEAERLELELADFDLQQLLAEIVDLLSLQAHDKGVRLYSTLDSAVPGVLHGDARRLRQIILNLLGNAIKFTPKGMVTLQVQPVETAEDTVTVRFEVRDNGIGIAAQQLQDIFQPFRQADSSTTRQYGGSGLGLAICKRLTELMGGEIGVESEVGRGSTFWFTVPLQPACAAVAPAAAGVARGNGGERVAPAAAEICLLLVEDDPIAREMMPKLLKEYGYRVEVACDGNEALKVLGERDYALVLMDCMMPNLSGYEVTEAIRNPATQVKRHDIPVLALTGNVMGGDRDRCLAVGMNDVVCKPLVLETLLAKIGNWLKAGGEGEQGG